MGWRWGWAGGRGGWQGPWPGRGPFSYLPPWLRPGWLFGRGACRWLFGFPWLFYPYRTWPYMPLPYPFWFSYYPWYIMPWFYSYPYYYPYYPYY
ncbi:MAG: hypothetical protein DRJ66_07490 [Thermoprotei archaeon]|nr:MAG: hypothetical protein DRJ66_07490 [Thermoprotei archaeon]RLF20543.1 MAG: hypothetical protein DRZ82_02005 [Thermoprotei archaeon]